MKNFSKKSILQKTIIAILVVLLLTNFMVPTYSHADFGGVLLSPIVDLLCSVGDAVINILQWCMTGNFGSSGAMNLSLSAFLMESEEYYAKYGTSATSTGDSVTIAVNPDDPDNGFDKGWLGLKDEYYIPVATYSPEQIFAGNVSGLDINFINPNKYTGQNESSASKLQPTIATWYVALRNLTVVGLLSVLVYVGIRIIISSTASDKAKYKQMLVDWLVALCLVFFLHYIMSFVLTMTESICQAVGGNGEATIIVEDEAKGATFGTNLLGLARFQTQYAGFGQKMAYLIMYLALVIYTLIFTWFYLKRLLMMAFLTLIAPVVALTYPIDKMNDGKAQAFDAWLKEYVFNALIQPFHLIIYTVFVGSAMDLASTNIIYMIAALAFILPAEKILRKFFGFEKAGAGTLGALAGGITAGSLLGKLGKGKGGGGSSKAPGGKSGPEGEKPPRFEKKHDISSIEDGDSKDAGRLGEASGGSSAVDANAVDDGENPVERMRREALEEKIADGQLSENDLSTEQRRLLGMNNNNNSDVNTDTTSNLNNKLKSPYHGKEDQEHMVQGLKNLARAHNLTPRGIGKGIVRGTGKAIKGVAKFGTRTAFKAAAGALPAAVALASGGGLASASAAFMATSSFGERAANRVIGAVENAPATFRREVDTFNGNTNMQDRASAREWKKDENNLQYLREQMAAQNGGVMPSTKEVKDKMNSFDPYLSEGLTDIKDMLKAQKAEQYGISSKQAAIIAAIGKERGITADILNDDKKAKAQQANLKQDFVNKGYSESAASKQANYTMNVWKVQNGVAHNMQKPQQSQPVQQPKQIKSPKTKK